MKPAMPWLLSANGGFVDTAGFLALHGLFTTHVTGNFVTLGASLVHGTSGAVAKLLALPLFCVVVVLTRLISATVAERHHALRMLLIVKVLLLTIGALLAIAWGPFENGDGAPALVTGMVLVAAMAIQNAVHRIHWGSLPPTTIMTGNTTQLMIDMADLLRGIGGEERRALNARFSRMGMSILSFAMGCALAALLYAWIGVWSFVLPPLASLLTLLMGE
ncbi:MAG TPA: YoaK family protein [Steroidobacteraceae bacterium]|jgi:uncharacterized membrane protein YoaK (UPF0700 family)